MGADSLYHIESWKDPEKILEMATIVVAGRAGTGTSLSSQIEYIENKYDATIYRLSSPVLEISSNDIRRRVRDGESIRYLLPSIIFMDIIFISLIHQKKYKRRMSRYDVNTENKRRFKEETIF